MRVLAEQTGGYRNHSEPTAFVQRDLPLGGIAAWSGAIVDIPTGWVLCDGNNGTPDLRDKFVVGAGSAYAVDDAAARTPHGHAFTGDGHTHQYIGGGNFLAGTDLSDTTNVTQITGTTDDTDPIQKYYALAYIMYTG